MQAFIIISLIVAILGVLFGPGGLAGSFPSRKQTQTGGMKILKNFFK